MLVFSKQIERGKIICKPDEHWARSSRLGLLWVHWWIGHAHQHDIVLANPGGGDLGGKENVEKNIPQVGVRSDQQLMLLALYCLDVQHANPFLHIAAVLLEEQLALLGVLGVVLGHLLDLNHWRRVLVIFLGSLRSSDSGLRSRREVAETESSAGA